MDFTTASLGSQLRVIAHLDHATVGQTGTVVEMDTKSVTLDMDDDRHGDKSTKRQFPWSGVQLASVPWSKTRAALGAVVDDPHLIDAFEDGAGAAVSTPLVPSEAHSTQEVELRKRSLPDSIRYLLQESGVDATDRELVTAAILSRFAFWLRDEGKMLDMQSAAFLNAAAQRLVSGR